jgi:23S rRNA (uracil1939-C5)-methyltransferase
VARRSRSRKKQPEPRLVTIESMSHEGRGITHVNGKTVFVFGALEQEKVLIQIVKTSRNFDQAVTLEVVEASPQRVEPRCAAYQVCGGCSLQHLGDDDQVQLKQQALLDMLEHVGINPGSVMPSLRSESWGYRKKARLGVKSVTKKGRVLVGFRERNSGFISDMHQCEVLLPKIGHHLDDLSELIGSLDAHAVIPQIEVAADADNVQLVFRHLQPLSDSDRMALAEFGKSQQFYIQLQPGGPETIENLYPEQQLLKFSPERDGPISIAFSASDFVQVNTGMNQKMVAQALSFLDLKSSDKVLDLFCGLGNFTLPMAQACEQVTGIEADAAMVMRAKQAALDNHIENSEYFAADLTKPESTDSWMRRRYDKILLDPPRSGAAEIVGLFKQFRASRIVYVSCQASSLVRDAGIICAQGYRLTNVGVMDMFPQTAHIEAMAVFER